MEGQIFLAQVMQLTMEAVAKSAQIPLPKAAVVKNGPVSQTVAPKASPVTILPTEKKSVVERSPQVSLQSQVAEFFQENSWLLTPVPQKTLMKMTYQGKNGLWECFAQTIDPKQQFVFYSVCPEMVPTKKRGAIAELLTRINADIILGNFELNYDQGEIRYKSSIEIDPKSINDDLSTLIKRVAFTNVQMMDRYLPSIRAVLEGEKVKDAIALA